MAGGGSGAKVVVDLPHDIRGVVADPTPWWVHALVLLAVVALAAALALVGRKVWRRWRDGRKAKTVGVDPWDVLLGEIKAMTPPDPLTREQAEEYYFALSLKLRQAIERRTSVAATDMTTGELRDLLRRRLPLSPTDVKEVVDFLERADVVKFAAVPSDTVEAEAWKARALRWAESLRPREDVLAGGGPG
jgi:hypothetical protein